MAKEIHKAEAKSEKETRNAVSQDTVFRNRTMNRYYSYGDMVFEM